MGSKLLFSSVVRGKASRMAWPALTFSTAARLGLVVGNRVTTNESTPAEAGRASSSTWTKEW
ncbi:MAG: hypothetical protein E6J20_21160 [Chloroflexi bacterium]|nr:MAG: hypothetical protein E6J20_21160 [Chloroflexota bacterium]